MRFQLLSVVIGYIDSEYESVNNIQLFLMLFRTKSKQINTFVKMWFQRLSGVIGYIYSEYDTVNNI